MLTTLLDYVSEVLSGFRQKQIVANTKALINQIISHKSIQLWRISEDKREFDRFSNVLNGKLKNVLDVETLNSSMQKTNLEKTRGRYSVLLLHDVSDIRKSYSEKQGELGWVKDKNGRWIRGYSTFNSVWLDTENKQLHLVGSTPYSNQSPDYVGKKELAAYQKGKLEGSQRGKEIETSLAQADNHNVSTITEQQLEDVHDSIRLQNSNCVITHVLDRGFVDFKLFDFIDKDLEDDFLVRLRKNINSNEQTINDKGKEVKLHLGDKKDWANSEEIVYEKIQFKRRLYKQVKVSFAWDSQVIGGSTYQVVRIRLYDNTGKRIFKDDMLLITNKRIKSLAQARALWQQYMQRMKIEGVFRFCKQVLGWEDFLVRDFELIKNLLCLCFFIAGYFYEIEDQLIKEHRIHWIAEVGGGKGKVTRYFFLEGIKNILIMKTMQAYLEENQISNEQVQDAIDTFTLIE